jgi:hypothetical protein
VRAAFLALMLFLFGCTQPVPARDPVSITILVTKRVEPVYISDEFLADDAEFIEEATQEWNRALRGQIYFDVVNTHSSLAADELENVAELHGIVFRQVFSDCNCVPDAVNAKSEHVNAWTQVGGTEINLVRDRILLGDMKKTAMHELGHTLGATDWMVPGLMSGGFAEDRWTCVDQKTMIEVAEYSHLRMQDVRWCTGPS